MKKIFRIFLISLSVMILTTNIIYATTELKERASESINKIFSHDIKIESNSSKEVILLKGQNIQKQDNEMKILDNNNPQEHYITYNIDENICKFESTTPITVNSNSTQEELVKELTTIINQLGNYDICYLTVADMLGVDYSLAYTYYAQNYDNESIDTQNKIYSIKTNFKDVEKDITAVDKFTIELQVNCLELMKLSSSDIDEKDSYTVTVIGNEDVDKNQENEVQQENKPTLKEEDKTTIKQEIPKAGLSAILGITIFGIVIFAIIIYIQNRKYKGIL